LLSELYHLILDETGYVRELRHEGTEEAESRIENLEEFDTLLQEFEEENYLDIPEESRTLHQAQLLPLFIEQSSLASEGDKQAADLPSVRMMTLHSSKGLEFPVVFLVGMEEGLFPSIKQWEEPVLEDIEEERRLCYVGITRARERLYLLNTVMRRLWGNISYNEPSRFFDELPSDCVEFHDFTRRMGGGPSEYRSPSHSTVAPSGGRENEWIGRKLNHNDYGMGTIIAIEGSGADRKVTVEFRGRQSRKFLLRYVESYIE
jgi:DNA helicase-2/ATP-dependent DNA helicase PcrA